jgi:ABC-type lipoprotein export system ATPase subunit
MIRLEGVTKRYPGAEVDVLRGVDLEVTEGEFVSVVGRSGSGKTTLLNLIGGLDSVFDGDVTVAGRSLRSLDDRSASTFRNRTVGFVFQGYHLLDHMTCRENVALASLFARGGGHRSGAEVRDRADGLLAEVGLEGHGDRHPATLSGGERQRVALARALFGEPPLLLCDEPTGNLDTTTAAEVVEVLFRLHERHGTTVVAATHDEALTGVGVRTFELVDGSLVGGVRS